MNKKSNGVSSPYKMIKSSLMISTVMIMAKFISFIRDMLLAQNLGASVISDVFLTSGSVLLVLTTFIRSPFAASYLPIATDYYYKESKKKQESLFGAVYGLAIVVGLITMLLEFIFLTPIVHAIVPGFTPEAIEQLKRIVVIQLPVMLCSFILAVNNGNLKLLNKFGTSEISEVFIQLFCVIYLIFAGVNTDINILSITVVIGYVVAVIFQLVIILKSGIRPKINFRFRTNAGIRSITRAMLPFILAAAARELNTLVDKIIGSNLDSGSITILSYASKITVTEVGLIATAISLVIYSDMAKYNTLDDKSALKASAVYGIKFINTLLIPLTIGTIVLREDIINILFGRGQFSSDSVKITATVMMIYAIGMMGSGVEDVLMRAMHATKHRKFPASVSVVMVMVNTLLDFMFYKSWGVYGLAAATTIASLASIVPLFIYFHLNVAKIDRNDGLVTNTILVLASSGMMGIAVFFINLFLKTLNIVTLIRVIISVFSGIMVYIAMMKVTKNEIAELIFTRGKGEK